MDVPLNGTTSNGNTALKTVNGLAVNAILVGDGTQETVITLNDLGTRVEEQEGTSSERALSLTTLEALVSNQSTLLVTNETSDGGTL